MVPDADTIIDPGTVMVKTLYTNVANGAMSASWCTDHFAVRAELGRIKGKHQL